MILLLKLQHQNECKYRPFNCPYIECEDKLAADDIVSHVKYKHEDEVRNSNGPEITAFMILKGMKYLPKILVHRIWKKIL